MGEGNIGRHFFNTIVSNRMKLPDELIGKRKVHYDSIFDVPMNWFIPAIHDESTMKEEIKILLARDLCHYVPKLKWMKDLLAKHIEHEFSDFTSQRSNVVSYHLLDGYSVIILYVAIQKSHQVTQTFLSSAAIICYPYYIKLVFNYK